MAYRNLHQVEPIVTAILTTNPAISVSAAGKAQRAKGNAYMTCRFHGGRTRLDDLFQHANAKIRLPKPEGPHLEAVMINTAGGLTGGDELDWRFTAQQGASLTVTSQACERIYKSSGGQAVVNTHLTAGENARLFWLPQETILFDRASLKRKLDIDLADEAEFIGLETIALGRLAMGETMGSGFLHDRWRITRGGQLIHADDVRLDGDIHSVMAAAPALCGKSVLATLVYIAPQSKVHTLDGISSDLRDLLPPSPLAGLSQMSDRVIIRIVSQDTYVLRPVIAALLGRLMTNIPCPKVWDT